MVSLYQSDIENEILFPSEWSEWWWQNPKLQVCFEHACDLCEDGRNWMMHSFESLTGSSFDPINKLPSFSRCIYHCLSTESWSRFFGEMQIEGKQAGSSPSILSKGVFQDSSFIFHHSISSLISPLWWRLIVWLNIPLTINMIRVKDWKAQVVKVIWITGPLSSKR